MAETAASALLNVIFQKLTDEAFNKFARSQNIHSELNNLQSTLSHIQDLLSDASDKEITENSVKQWLNSLQQLAYDIDDVLDDVATEAMRRELSQESEAITSKVRNLIVPTCCTKFSLSQRLHHKLDSINTKLQHLENQKSDLGLIVKNEKPKNNNRGNKTSLLESDVIGRENEKQKLLNKLLQDEPSEENFSVLPIVGMGGIGKTTLARFLYNDTQVKGRFELHAWVCVSDDFDISKITKTIFQAVSNENKESLAIFKCGSLRHVSLPRATTTGGEGQNLKSLTSLSISSCQKMELFPDLHQLSNLTRLSIRNCESIESFPNLQLPNLTELSMFCCKNMKAFGDLQLPNLISWRIEYCENLESFPDIQLSNLTKLKYMCIRKCPMIDASFPHGLWPPNLCFLETGGLKKPISEWGYQNFPASLVDLILSDEPDVRNFSQLSHLFPSSLASLYIGEFDNLKSLSTGLQHLTSLQHLRISKCSKVNDLPETLLPSLLRLRIDECPKLKKRCNGRGSHYWPLISHIPCIELYDY